MEGEICKKCHKTCKKCNGIGSDACLVCGEYDNRYLRNGECLPKPSYYECNEIKACSCNYHCS